MKLKYSLSIAAGLISVAAIGYRLLAPLWGFPDAERISSTAEIVVMMLSMVLFVFTGEKIARNYTAAGVTEAVTETRTYTDGNMMSDEKFSDEYEDLPLVKVGYAATKGKHSL